MGIDGSGQEEMNPANSGARMRRKICLMALLVGSLSLVGTSASAQVLGVEAAGALKRWTGDLRAVDVDSIAIQKSTVLVSLKGDCVLGLHHPERPGCADAVRVGNTALCWKGAGCPVSGDRPGVLKAAGALKLPWRAPVEAGPGERGGPSDDEMVAARTAAGIAFWRNAHDQARALLAPLLQRENLRTEEWMTLLPLASRAGLGKEAWSVTERSSAGDLAPGHLVSLKVTLLMGPDMGAAVARALLNQGNACSMEDLASAYVDVRAYHAAILLSEAVRQLDPDCFEAYSDESEAATRLQDLERQKRVVEAAMERFGGDPRLGPMEEVYLMDQGKAHLVQERLEKRLKDGDKSPSLLSELLTFYIHKEGRQDRLKGFTDRLKKEPEDHQAALFAGVILHYEREFARSQSHLDKLGDVFPEIYRVQLVMSLNAFNLGDREGAQTHIARAVELDKALPTRNPDVPAAVAEIYRDTDPKRSLDALRTYWNQTVYEARPDSDKRRWMWPLIGALQRCIARDKPGPCLGPWEHYFDRVALDAQEQEQAEMVAELRGKGLIGGGTDGPPEDLMVPPGMTRPPEGWEPGMKGPPGVDVPPGWEEGWKPGMELPAEFEMPEGFEIPEGFEMPENFEMPEGFDPAQGMPDGFEMPEGFEFPEGWQYGMPKEAMQHMNVPEDKAPYNKRAPTGMVRGTPWEEANVPGTMPPGYEAPKGWKPGDALLPGMTPPEVEKLRAEEDAKKSK